MADEDFGAGDKVIWCIPCKGPHVRVPGVVVAPGDMRILIEATLPRDESKRRLFAPRAHVFREGARIPDILPVTVEAVI